MEERQELVQNKRPANAIRLTNATAKALRRQAKMLPRVLAGVGVALTVAAVVLAVYWGLHWLPAVPLTLLAAALLNALLVWVAHSRTLTLTARAICTEAAARGIRQQVDDRQRREQAVLDLMAMQKDASPQARSRAAERAQQPSPEPFGEAQEKLSTVETLKRTRNTQARRAVADAFGAAQDTQVLKAVTEPRATAQEAKEQKTAPEPTVAAQDTQVLKRVTEPRATAQEAKEQKTAPEPIVAAQTTQPLKPLSEPFTTTQTTQPLKPVSDPFAAAQTKRADRPADGANIRPFRAAQSSASSGASQMAADGAQPSAAHRRRRQAAFQVIASDKAK